MTRLLKIRYIIIIMVAVALLTSVTAFSVSYAKWTGGTDSLTADVRTGEWGGEQPPEITNGITYTDENGKTHTMAGDNADENSPFYNCENYLGGQFILYVKPHAAGQKFRLYINGIDFESGNGLNVIFNTGNDNILTFADGEFTVTKLDKSEEYFCFSIARNPEDNSVIIFVISVPGRPDKYVDLGA